MLSSHSTKKRKRSNKSSQTANVSTSSKKVETNNPLADLRNIAFKIQTTIGLQKEKIKTYLEDTKALNNAIEKLTDSLKYLEALIEQSHSTSAISIFKKTLRLKLLIKEVLDNQVNLDYLILSCQSINLNDLIKKIDTLHAEETILPGDSSLEQLPFDIFPIYSAHLGGEDFYSLRLTSRYLYHTINDCNSYKPLPPDLAVMIQNEKETTTLVNYVLLGTCIPLLGTYEFYRKILVELALAFSQKSRLSSKEIEDRMEIIFCKKTYEFFSSKLPYLACLAAEQGHVSILQYLYKMFQDKMLNIATKENSWSPLIYAMEENQVAAVKFITKVHPEAMNYVDRYKKYPLMHYWKISKNAKHTHLFTESFWILYNASNEQLKQSYLNSAFFRANSNTLLLVKLLLESGTLPTLDCWKSLAQNALAEEIKQKEKPKKALPTYQAIYKLFLTFQSSDTSYMEKFNSLKIAFFVSDEFIKNDSFKIHLSLLNKLSNEAFLFILYKITVDSLHFSQEVSHSIALEMFCSLHLTDYHQHWPLFHSLLRLILEVCNDKQRDELFGQIKKHTEASYLFSHIAKLLKDIVDQHYFLPEESIYFLKKYLLETNNPSLPIKFILLDLGITPPFHAESYHGTFFPSSMSKEQQCVVDSYLALFMNEGRFPYSSLKLACGYTQNILTILKNIIMKLDHYSIHMQMSLIQFIFVELITIYEHPIDTIKLLNKIGLTHWINNVSKNIPESIKLELVTLINKLCAADSSAPAHIINLQDMLRNYLAYSESNAEGIVNSTFPFKLS